MRQRANSWFQSRREIVTWDGARLPCALVPTIERRRATPNSFPARSADFTADGIALSRSAFMHGLARCPDCGLPLDASADAALVGHAFFAYFATPVQSMETKGSFPTTHAS